MSSSCYMPFPSRSTSWRRLACPSSSTTPYEWRFQTSVTTVASITYTVRLLAREGCVRQPGRCSPSRQAHQCLYWPRSGSRENHAGYPQLLNGASPLDETAQSHRLSLLSRIACGHLLRTALGTVGSWWHCSCILALTSQPAAESWQTHHLVPQTWLKVHAFIGYISRCAELTHEPDGRAVITSATAFAGADATRFTSPQITHLYSGPVRAPNPPGCPSLPFSTLFGTVLEVACLLCVLYRTAPQLLERSSCQGDPTTFCNHFLCRYRKREENWTDWRIDRETERDIWQTETPTDRQTAHGFYKVVSAFSSISGLRIFNYFVQLALPSWIHLHCIYDCKAWTKVWFS